MASSRGSEHPTATASGRASVRTPSWRCGNMPSNVRWAKPRRPTARRTTSWPSSATNLRTPLATIIAGLRVLRQLGGPDERARHTREAIERQANSLSRMVDDLLDMKKIVTGVLALERKPCDLADVVAGFLATFNEAGRFKQHTLSVDAEPVWVNGDAMRLQ